MSEVLSITKLSNANRMLAEVASIDDALDLIDLAEAGRVYARQIDLGIEAQNHAAEIKIRAQFKAGEILDQMEKAKGAAEVGWKTPLHDERALTAPPTYSELGINYRDAHNYQNIYRGGENVLNEYIEETKSKKKELTTTGAVKTAKSTIREKKKERLSNIGEVVKDAERWSVSLADIREYQTDKQYDFIITDPPYPKEYLPLYSVLAEKAKSWLKPGGLLIAMCGQSYLDQIFKMLGDHLAYYWTAAYLLPGQPTPLRQRQVNACWKPLLIYGLSDDYSGKIFSDVFKSDGNDKDFHEWGQSTSGMLSIVSQICLPGQSIFDPFCGAGTTGIAALRHGCLFDGIDIDEKNVNISKARLAKEENDETAKDS